MTARAGTLTWDVDVSKAEEAHRKVEELGRKLNAAFAPRATTPSVFKTVGEEADRATVRVREAADAFTKLRAQHELGHISSKAYRQELVDLQNGIRVGSHLVDENTQSFRQLATVYGQTERELARLTREQERSGKAAEHLTREQQRVAASELRQRIRSLVNEVAVLRNEWQETGQDTEQTKERLAELRGEMGNLRVELMQSEGGWDQYNAEIRQLAVAGRSAQATIDGMEGRMSRLGLASQVSLGATDALRRELGRLGPAGNVAGAGLGIISGEMQKLMDIGPERLIQGITGGIFRLGSAAALVGGALAVGLSAALFKATESAAQYAREIENATFRTGLSVEAQQELQHAARSTGVPLELLSTTMQRLQRRAADANAGNKGLRESFDRLGVSLTDNEGKMRSTEDLLGQVADGLNSVENNADRVALAFKIFDTEGGRLLPMLNEGSEGIKRMRDEARELGLVITEDTILSLSQFHGEIETLKQQFQTARIEMTAAFLPVVRDLLMPLLSDQLVPVIQGLASDLGEFTDRLFDASEEGEVLRAKVASLIAPLLAAGDIAILAGTSVFGGLQTIATGIQLLANEVRIYMAEVRQDWRNLWIGWGDGLMESPAMREFVDERLGEGAYDSMIFGQREENQVITDLKAQQTRIMGEFLNGLDAWGPPLRAAGQRLLEGGYGEGVAEALRGMGVTVRERGNRIGTELGESIGDGAKQAVRTVDDIFEELELKGTTAERAAIAAGGTLENQLDSLETRAKLVDTAINEMMARPDILEGNNADRLSYLLTRAEDLKTAIAEVQDLLDRLGRDPAPGGTVEAMEAAEVLGPTAGMSTGLSPAALRHRLRQAAARAAAADQAVWDAYQEAMYDPARVERMAVAEVSGPGAGMSTGLSPEGLRARLRAVRARMDAEFMAAYEQYVEAMNDPARLSAMAEAEVEGPSGGMSTALSPGALRARLRAAQARIDAEFNAVYEAYLERMQDPDRVQAMIAAEVEGPGAGMSTGLSPENLRARLAEARVRGLPELEPETIESLQRQLIELRNRGADPASEAIQRLVRQIRELQLRAALEELREKGVKNLSAFAESVLRAHGVLEPATVQTVRFSDALRDLGDVSASGLADVLDGISRIGRAGGDATEIVEGLTQAINGARVLIDSFTDGDAFEAIRSLAMLFGEGLSMVPGMPDGLGALAGGIFDLGRSIVQAISDAFTGDSPAARAIREGLTPAVQSAFTNGILMALQGGEDWHEVLRENVKLAFLTSLINAFVQSAIIGPILQPIFTEYSKMVARGQFEAAGEFLASTLPGAINQGIQLAEQFISQIPGSLIPTPPTSPQPGPGAGTGTGPQPTGLFELPTAAVTGIAAPDWARDLVNAGRMQLEAAASFSAAVELLRTEGILLRQADGGSNTSGSAAAARAV